jgi:3'-5' exoribonuclease
MRPAREGEYVLTDLEEQPPIAYEQLKNELDELIGQIEPQHLKALLFRLIDPSTETGARYHVAPAAKYYHQAYKHGLLEHCLSVAQGVMVLARGPFRGGVDRDLAVTGALVHDIGKIEVYASLNGAIELTDRGKLLGEIPLGYYLVRREIERIEGFPAGDAEGLLHIVLSHHGKLEHGSPVVPCTREATLVHFVDNLGGNLGSFDRIERTLAEGASWSDFDRGIQASAFFSAREQARREEAA